MSRCHSRFEDTNLSPEERSARREVRLLRGFYSHLSIFLLVNGGLALINLLTHPERLWFTYTMLGWGIFLALHGLRVALRGRWLGQEWEEAKVSQILQRKQGQ